MLLAALLVSLNPALPSDSFFKLRVSELQRVIEETLKTEINYNSVKLLRNIEVYDNYLTFLSSLRNAYLPHTIVFIYRPIYPSKYLSIPSLQQFISIESYIDHIYSTSILRQILWSIIFFYCFHPSTHPSIPSILKFLLRPSIFSSIDPINSIVSTISIHRPTHLSQSILSFPLFLSIHQSIHPYIIMISINWREHMID